MKSVLGNIYNDAAQLSALLCYQTSEKKKKNHRKTNTSEESKNCHLTNTKLRTQENRLQKKRNVNSQEKKDTDATKYIVNRKLRSDTKAFLFQNG